MNHSIAHVVIDGAYLRTYTPYNPIFVDELKRSIPSAHRRWEVDARCWRIASSYEDVIVELCEEHFGEVHVSRLEEETRAVVSDHAVLHLLPSAPRPVIDAAFRALARMHHPDISEEPDATGRMQEINRAYEQLVRAS